MENTKIVRYDIWCEKCVRAKEDGGENPVCNACLTTPVNMSSTKPIYFQPKENTK